MKTYPIYLSPRQAVPAPSARVETKDLPSQNEIFKPSEKITQPRLEIGEGDMLKTIMDEMPGLDYDQRTLKQLCDKQDKQTLLLTKEQQQYNQKIKNKHNKIVDVRKRQLLMCKLKFNSKRLPIIFFSNLSQGKL